MCLNRWTVKLYSLCLDKICRSERDKMKYKIRMYSFLLIDLACLVLTTVCSFFVKSAFLSMLILFLLLMEMLVATQRPKRLFQRQLNDNFMIVRFPGSRWYGIFQKPAAVLPKTDCSLIYRNLCKSMLGIFSFIQQEHGYYRTITHEIVIRRLEKEEKAGNLEILTCEPAYKKDLSNIFHQAMRGSCWGCNQSKICPHLLAAKKKRQFYYIEFHISKHERPEGLPLA